MEEWKGKREREREKTTWSNPSSGFSLPHTKRWIQDEERERKEESSAKFEFRHFALASTGSLFLFFPSLLLSIFFSLFHSHSEYFFILVLKDDGQQDCGMSRCSLFRDQEYSSLEQRFFPSLSFSSSHFFHWAFSSISEHWMERTKNRTGRTKNRTERTNFATSYHFRAKSCWEKTWEKRKRRRELKMATKKTSRREKMKNWLLSPVFFFQQNSVRNSTKRTKLETADRKRKKDKKWKKEET